MSEASDFKAVGWSRRISSCSAARTPVACSTQSARDSYEVPLRVHLRLRIGPK